MSRTILRFSPSPRSPRHARTTSPTRCRAGDKRKGEGEAPHVRAGRNAGRNGAPRRSMPDGEKSGTGRGSPSRQGRTGSRTEWARHPAQCRMERKAERGGEAPHVRAGRNAGRNGAPRRSMPDGEKGGTGRGSPSRQGRAERRAERNALPHQGRTGKRKNAVPASRSGAAPGEKHIDAGRGKCGTGRVFLSYQSRARTADGAGMEARPPGRSVERLAAAQA